jgi:hypothetical protein
MNDSSVVVLGFGPQPIDFLSKSAKLCGKDAVVCPHTAQMSGANFAVGHKETLEKLRQLLSPGAIEAEKKKHSGILSENAIRWLATGERGLSSNTLFTFLTGVDAECGSGHHYPRDTSDFKRCRRIIVMCPELLEHLHKVSEAGPEWAGIAEKWDELTAMMDSEAPNWLESKYWRAEATNAMLREIINNQQEGKTA